jgi:hypothetical protein
MTGVQQKTTHEIGIDITAKVIGTEDDPDCHKNNIGPGKHFPGGPTCELFNGKEVPCMVQWSKKGGITSEIPTDYLRTMDELELFPLVDGLKPFLIVDGHGSRLELPFLNYINDPDHEWVVCLGVPYGTAYWQVGDSKQQNGLYKIYLTKAKMLLIRRGKIEVGMKVIRVKKYEIIPCVNAAFGPSFGNVQGTKTALCERG